MIPRVWVLLRFSTVYSMIPWLKQRSVRLHDQARGEPNKERSRELRQTADDSDADAEVLKSAVERCGPGT